MDPAFVTMTGSHLSRRRVLHLAVLGLALTCTQSRPSHALKPGKPSKERLLRGTREEKTEEQLEEERIRLAEERRIRLDKQRELQAAAERRKAGFDNDTEEIEIESNLRGQYYFPTARKRYLPRVKLAWDLIPTVEDAVRGDQWGVVINSCEGLLMDAVLPMRLYASSLAGGGLNINARFIDNMNSETERYENALKKLMKAAKTKDFGGALGRLADLRNAIQNYRVFGHLEASDFGIGEIPTGTRVGSGFGNNNSTLYGKNKSVQDVKTGIPLER